MIVGALEIQMMADLAQLRKDMSSANDELSKTAKAAEYAADTIKRALAGVSAVLLVREFVSMADAVQNMDARLKLATKTQEDFSGAQKSVYDISQRNLVSLESTAKVYSRLNPVVEKMGGTTQYTAAVTEALSAALRVSGASTQEASSVLIQFSQAMSSGALRGEEFNSVSENGSRVLDALSNQLGKNRGELRKMAADGKLTADVVGNALVKELEKLRAEAAAMPLTVAGAWQRMQNDLALYADQLNKTYGITKLITGAMELFRTNLSLVSDTLVAGIKITAAYFAIFHAAPAVIAAVVAGFNGLMLALAHIATGGVIASGAMSTLTSSIVMANAATGTLVGSVTALQAVLGVVFAAFVGWEIGTWARKNFLEVELFGIAMVNGLLKGWEHLKFGTAVIVEAISSAWEKTFSSLGSSMAWFLDKFSAGLEALGLDESAKKVAKWASSIKSSTRETVDFTDKLADLQKQHAGNIKTIDDITNSMADEAIAARQLNTDITKVTKAVPLLTGATEAGAGAATKAAAAKRALSEMNKELDQSTKTLIDSLLDEVTATLKAHEAANGIIESIKFETEALRMTNTEREIATRLRELERTGIEKGTEAYEEYAAAIRKAVLDKTAVEESVRLAKEQADELKKFSDDIGKGLTDSLFRAFESGKGFWDTLWSGIKNTLKTTALKVMLQPVQQGIASMLGGGGATGALSSLGNLWNAGKGLLTGAPILGSSLTSWFTNFGDSFGTVVSNLGEALYSSGFEKLGDWLLSTTVEGAGGVSVASAFGSFAGDALGYLGSISAAMKGQWGSAAGQAIGAYFGGPLGSMLGGAIGGLADKLFGGNGTHHAGAGYLSSGAGSGMEVTNGMYGLDWSFGDSVGKYRSQGVADALKTITGGSAQMLNDLSKAFGGTGGFQVGAYFASDNDRESQGSRSILKDGQLLSAWTGKGLDKDAQKGLQQLTNALAGQVRSAMLQIDLPTWAKTALESLGANATMEQLAAAVQAITATKNALQGLSIVMNPLGGVFTAIANSSENARMGLANVAGGMDALLAKTKQFVDDYYSEGEKAAIQARMVVDTLRSMGLSTDINTKMDFRALVESFGTKLEDATAQKNLVGLLDLGPQFAELADYIQGQQTTLEDLAAQAPAVTALQTFNDKQSQYQVTLDRSATAAEETVTAVDEGFATLGETFSDGLAYLSGNFNELSGLFKGWDNGDALNVNVVTP